MCPRAAEQRWQRVWGSLGFPLHTRGRSGAPFAGHPQSTQLQTATLPLPGVFWGHVHKRVCRAQHFLVPCWEQEGSAGGSVHLEVQAGGWLRGVPAQLPWSCLCPLG